MSTYEDTGSSRMEWLRQRCARSRPKCICPGCRHFGQMLTGVRCCAYVRVGRVYDAKQTCGVVKCPGFQAKKEPPRGANTEAATQNMDTVILTEKGRKVNEQFPV